MHTIATLELGARALRQLEPGVDGWQVERLHRELRRTGCPSSQVARVVELLAEARLLHVANHHLKRIVPTDSGRRVARELQDGIWDGYVAALLNLRWARQQLSASLRFMRRQDSGLVLDTRGLRFVAPQLGVILSWARSTELHLAHVPESVLRQVHFVDAPPSTPDWVLANESVGFRAEQYTLHYERSRKAPGSILHVSGDSDRYGYDVEDRSEHPPVAIEVKGSAHDSLAFYLSANELGVARRLGGKYLLHFWGGVDLRRHMVAEYSVLRASGYPQILVDPASMIDDGRLLIYPSSWRVEADETSARPAPLT